MNNFDIDLIKFGFEGEKALNQQILNRYGIQFSEKEIIINENEISDEIFYILKGSVYAAKKDGSKYKVLNIVKKGELFGEMAVFDVPKRSATIIARENTICLKFPKKDFIEIFKLHPRWVDKIIEEMTGRIVTMLKKI